jgi:hypothetical protein
MSYDHSRFTEEFKQMLEAGFRADHLGRTVSHGDERHDGEWKVEDAWVDWSETPGEPFAGMLRIRAGELTKDARAVDCWAVHTYDANGEVVPK